MQHTRSESWWQRNWKWIAVGVGAFAALALFVGGVFVVIIKSMTSSEAYRNGLSQAQANVEVVEALGEPVKAGYFVTGSINVAGPSGNADLAIPLSGPRGSGTLYVRAEKKAGRWEMELLEVEVSGRADRIELLRETRGPGV